MAQKANFFSLRFDAFMNGRRETIVKDRIPQSEKWEGVNELHSFHRRSAVEFGGSATARNKTLRSLAKDYNCRFGFFNNKDDPLDPSQPTIHAYAYAHSNYEYIRRHPRGHRRIYVYLCYTYLEPLLDSNLNSSERQSLTWNFAHTVIIRTRAILIDSILPYTDSP